MPRLLIKNPDGSENLVSLKGVRTTIGRSVRNDICISDPFASRFHAEIRQENEFFFLRDLGSANGTFCNEKIVSGLVRLSPRDEIRLGETKIIFLGDEVDAESVALFEDREFDPLATVFIQPEIGSSETNRRELFDLINKVGMALLGSMSLEETLNLIVSQVFEIIPAERCIVLLNDRDELKVAVAKERNRNVSGVRISRKIVNEVLSNRRSILTSNAQLDQNLASQTLSFSGVNSILAVPLVTENEILGMIYADSSKGRQIFTEEHLNILTTLASVASIRIEKDRLTEERLARERLEYELKLAAEIQQRLQPSSIPEFRDYEFEGISIPCYEIGGDYYDFVLRNEEKIVLALGDVSGKGTSAALMMASLHAAIRSQLSLDFDLSKTLTAVNQYFVNCFPQNRFVTLFIAELNMKNGTFEYVNAGHEAALLVRKNGGVEKLESSSLPLGIFEGVDYKIITNCLEPGDFLVAFSDGVTEAISPDGKEFGVERLAEVICENIDLSASRIRDKIDSTISGFTGNTSFKDDLTLLIVKRKA